MSDPNGERECPYCRETINGRAVRCHFCLSGITPVIADAVTSCPRCGEAIKAGALKCRHCQAMLVEERGLGTNHVFLAAGVDTCKADCFFQYTGNMSMMAACFSGCDFHVHLRA